MKIHYYNKHLEDTSFEERFDFTQKLIRKIDEKSRVRIHCYGKENLPQETGYLITPNHQGLFDALILFDTHDRPFKAVVKQELMDVPVLKNVLSMIQFVAMDRSNLRASMKIIKTASKEISEGMNYVIFPEGTRIKEPGFGEAKAGLSMFAIKGKAMVVPISIISNYKLFNRVTIYIDKPISFEDYYRERLNTKDYERLSQNVLEVIKENYYINSK